jgi:hypothetical protein
MSTNSTSPKLSEIPLWRLLVMLEDTKRSVGSNSEAARILSRAIQERRKAAKPRLTIAAAQGGSNASR